jgi:hypothetical protein
MPKVILEFDSFEDSEELKVALDGGKWKNVVWELGQYLRNTLKNPSDSMSDETYKELEKVSSEFYEIIHDNQLYLD